MNFFTDTEVTAKHVIEKLERDEAPEQNANISRPASDDEIAMLRRLGRI